MGTAAAAAFRDPSRFAGRNIPLAGDELTPLQMCEAFAAAQGGGPVKHSCPPAWLFWFLSKWVSSTSRPLWGKGHSPLGAWPLN
jgi:hypothetical protein